MMSIGLVPIDESNEVAAGAGGDANAEISVHGAGPVACEHDIEVLHIDHAGVSEITQAIDMNSAGDVAGQVLCINCEGHGARSRAGDDGAAELAGTGGCFGDDAGE